MHTSKSQLSHSCYINTLYKYTCILAGGGVLYIEQIHMHTSKSQLSHSCYINTLYAITLTKLFIVSVLITALHSFAACRHFAVLAAAARGLATGGHVHTSRWWCAKSSLSASSSLLSTGSLLGNTSWFLAAAAGAWRQENWLNFSMILDMCVVPFLVAHWSI